MSRRTRRLALTLAAVASLTLAVTAGAAPEGSSFQITPFAGYGFFVDPINAPGHVRLELEDAPHFGGALGWQINRWVGFQAGAGFSATEIDAPGGGDADVLRGALDFMVTPFQAERWDVYGLLGGGFERLESDDIERDHGTFDLGLGVRLWLADAWGLRVEGRNVLLLSRSSVLGRSHDNQYFVTGGITFATGGTPRDADGDGVPDRRDECPNTPAGARVDARGCPIDSDRDGVADGLDRCDATPAGARVDASGCPQDADGDGVADGIDQCADTPRGATVNAQGCPSDSDGDRVPDGIDACPNTPAGAAVDERGCPRDSDGDGVSDGLDKCPDTSAGLRVDAEGCPIEVIEKETELLDTGMIRLQDINFETAKADLVPESLPRLDVVGQVLLKWPELRIEIGGHTDSRGSNAYNQQLSEARAQSVLTYLTGKYPALQATQLTAKGYGESKPVARNDNALNMARTRRVEFVVLNQDVLRREVERRRALPKE